MDCLRDLSNSHNDLAQRFSKATKDIERMDTLLSQRSSSLEQGNNNDTNNDNSNAQQTKETGEGANHSGEGDK